MCNDALIRNNTLMGKPTEGALIALAMKVRTIWCFLNSWQVGSVVEISCSGGVLFFFFLIILSFGSPRFVLQLLISYVSYLLEIFGHSER